MNSFLMVMILKTMPRIDANEYEDGRIPVKPRDDWRNDIFNWLIAFVASTVSFFVLTHVPYIETLFFIAGFLGMVLSLMYSFRAILVYRYYDDLFTKENIDKLIK